MMKVKLFIILTSLLVMGCSSEKEKHTISKSGIERGVRIEVILVGGGRATLVCPKFNSEPMGSHGRECYLDSYNKGKN